jgi:hypothetical protein
LVEQVEAVQPCGTAMADNDRSPLREHGASRGDRIGKRLILLPESE